MIDINDEASVLEILTAAQIPLIQLPERTLINPRGKVIKLRLTPCFSLQALPSSIGDLTHLEEIYLFWGGHDFASLPSTFSKLRNLKILQLRWCQNLRSIPVSMGSKLQNLEEVIFEGCSNLQQFSCFFGDAKTRWTRLKKLQIDFCPLIQRTFEEIFSTRSSGDAVVYFPSLTYLSLRRNNLNDHNLASLWKFIQHCPNLKSIDFSDNHVSSLKELMDVATTTTRTRTNFSQSILSHLNLAGNPILATTTTTREPSDESRDDDYAVVPMDITIDDYDDMRYRDLSSEQYYFVKILESNPRIQSIVTCHDGANNGTSVQRNVCFKNSKLYSTRTEHALDMNSCCNQGQRTLLSSETFSLSMWPLVLHRAKSSASKTHCHPQSPSYYCQQCQSSGQLVDENNDDDVTMKDESQQQQQQQQREASLLFTLLHGPVFASRGNNYTLYK
jgi:Leucine-rich repeat (LRR) protein